MTITTYADRSTDRSSGPRRARRRPWPRLAIAVVLCATALAAAAEEPSPGEGDGVTVPGFLPQMEISTGATTAPRGIVLHDLSGDGVPDMAVTISTPGTFDQIDVRIGFGDGTFGSAVVYSVGGEPADLAVGDMDRDGDTDLVVCNSASSDVSVLRNNGDGTFAPEVFFSTGTEPVACRVADVDNDSFLDIVTANRTAENITVLTNDGTGAAYTAATYASAWGGTNGRMPTDVAAGDFNNDGAIDIVVTSGMDDQLVLLYNTGSGTFFDGDFAYYIPSGSGPAAVEPYDFDHDGWLDVVVANEVGNNLLVHFNDGPAVFPLLVAGPSIAAGSGPTAIGLGDHDLDGDIDLMVALRNVDNLQLLLGDGLGTFTPYATYPVGDAPAAVAVADLDRDGDPDVGTANQDGDSVSILLNRFNILFGPPPVARLDAPTAVECLCGSDDVIGVAHVDLGLLDHWTLEYRSIAVDSWTLLIDSDVDVPEPGSLLTTWDTTGLPEGRHLLKLTVHSLSGLSATDEVVVWVSRDFDVSTFDFLWGNVGMPSVADFVAGDACPIGSVYDNGCGPASYTVEYRPAGGGSWTPIDPGMPSYPGGVTNGLLGTWDTIAASVPDGAYNVRAVGTNLCGQQQTATRTVTVDNTPPVAELTAPVSCTVYEPGDLVEITGTASDANLVGWSLSVIGGPYTTWHSLATGSSSVVAGVLEMWDTTGLEECGYVLRLRVTDAAVPNCGPSRRDVVLYRALGLGINGCMFADGVEIGATSHWDGTVGD